MEDITTRFRHLFEVISTDDFINKKSLGGEIPFYIKAYDAKQEVEIVNAIKLLKNKLETNGVKILELNLYDIVCEILEEKGGMDRMFTIEKTKNKEKFLRALQSTLNIHETLMPRIKTKIAENESNVYFLTGIGLVFPFIRAHNILNNLQSITNNTPTVTFFPGDYNGNALKLFGVLKDDKHYRDINIDQTELKA